MRFIKLSGMKVIAIAYGFRVMAGLGVTTIPLDISGKRKGKSWAG